MFLVFVSFVFAFLLYVVCFNWFNLNAGFHVRENGRKKKNFVGGRIVLLNYLLLDTPRPCLKMQKKSVRFCFLEGRFCARRQYRRPALA